MGASPWFVSGVSTPAPYATAANITATEPTGLLNNDIILASLYIESSTAVTPPTGWSNIVAGTTMSVSSSIGAPYKQYLYWIRRGNSSPSLVWTFASSFRGIVLVGYRGAMTEGAPFSFGTTGLRDTIATRIYPDVSATTTGVNHTLVWMGANNSGGTSNTPPTGFTERMDIATDENGEVADKVQAAAGSTGTVTAAAWVGGSAAPASVMMVGLIAAGDSYRVKGNRLQPAPFKPGHSYSSKYRIID